MHIFRWFKSRSSLVGISYFSGDELRVAFLEPSGGGYRIIGTESVPLSGDGSAFSDLQSRFRNRLSGYQSRSPLWIHLVMRQAALVKVFSLGNVSAESREAEVEKRIHSEIPYLADEVILHRVFQETQDPNAVQVLVFGVSKAVLSDQMKKLAVYGVVPERVLLSTEVLTQLFKTQILPLRKPEPS